MSPLIERSLLLRMMFLLLLCPCALAQTPGDAIELNLVGNRFAPLEYAQLDEQQ